ncbi:hypothetical protein [Pseudoclavibacter helvolus]|uniref:hypothetical protein n=1 Tax=Pseudoclavibacter helvolus TaxID=255205 RepID=UPI003734E990
MLRLEWLGGWASPDDTERWSLAEARWDEIVCLIQSHADVHLALHEERFPLAVFLSEPQARAWIAEQDDDEQTFSVQALNFPRQ